MRDGEKKGQKWVAKVCGTCFSGDSGDSGYSCDRVTFT